MKTKEIFQLIDELSQIKKIDKEIIKENLAFALEKAYLKEFPEANLKIEIDLEKEKIKMWEEKLVIDDSNESDMDDDREITLSDALKYSSSAKIGSEVKIPIEIDSLDRRVAVHVQQVFSQKISEQSNTVIYKNWHDKIGTNIRAKVENNSQRYIEVELGDTKGALLKQYQIPGEQIKIGGSYTFYIKDVKEQTKGWPIILSRNDVNLVKNLLIEFIPEIKDGTIEIKGIARVPGFKTKIAVKSNVEGVDPIGTCVGPNGSRVKEIIKLIGGEFVDIILWDEDPKQFLVNACAPESLIGVEITDDEESSDGLHKYVTLVVDDKSLAKVIGKNGMNIKLISKLTNWSIDVVEESIAIEDKINYELVGHLVPIKPSAKKEFFNVSLSKPKNNNNNKQRNVVKIDDDEEFVYMPTNHNTFEINDEDIESLINFTSAPKKEKEIDINLDLEEIYEKDKKNLTGPKHKKAKNKSKSDVDSDVNNLFEEFGDITENFLSENENDDLEDVGSDNLELDEE